MQYRPTKQYWNLLINTQFPDNEGPEQSTLEQTIAQAVAHDQEANGFAIYGQ